MKLSSEDLMIVLALCREQTLERSAHFLDKDVSSVFRAIKRIEKKVGTPLFERSKLGFHPSPAAEELAEKGSEISDALSAAHVICSELGGPLSGRLRVTTTDLLLEYYILPNLADFRREFPNINIDFSTSNQFAKLWERGFDIAVRPSANPPEQLLGQFVKQIEYVAVCGAKYPLSEVAPDRFDWLVPGSSLAQHPIRRWVSNNIPESASITSFDSMNLMVTAVHANLGVAFVPNLKSLTNGLVQLERLEIDEVSEIWCLYHPSNRGNPLVQAFNQFMKRTLG